MKWRIDQPFALPLMLLVVASPPSSLSSQQQRHSLCDAFNIQNRPTKAAAAVASSGDALANSNNVAFQWNRRSRLDAATALPLENSSAATTASAVASSNTSEGDDPSVGVLMLNLGGPETGEDVEGFLFNLFADPDIIRLPGPLAPLQSTIAYIISKRRAPKSRAAYESIGGGSPILKYSNAQADLVRESLQKRYGLDVKTYIGMRYWKPFTEEALDAIQKDGIKALVVLPLYPQFSISTSGSSLRVLQEEFAKHASRYGDMVHTVVPSWYERTGYVSAMTNLIQKELDSFTPEELQQSKDETPDLAPMHILFSAHGVPKSYIEAGDPYQKQIEKCVDKIGSELLKRAEPGTLEVHLSYQSRVGPIEWLRPYTDDVLPDLGSKGVRNLVVVPVSFVSEHIETLEEIDMEYRELAEENGVSNWRRCPALNTDPAFIEDMADIVYEALLEPAQTVTEACVANNVGNIDLVPLDTTEVSTTGIGGVGADGALFQVSESLKQGERVTARTAIAAVLLAIFIEFISGQPFTNFLGL